MVVQVQRVLFADIGFDDARVSDDFSGRALSDDFAEIDGHHARHQLHELAQLVFNQQNGEMLFAVQLAYQHRQGFNFG